jgi:hypothetical protein
VRVTDSVDMQAVYMASVVSPLCGPRRGRFKIGTLGRRLDNVNVLSQVVEDDVSDYERDSFCCDDDEEEFEQDDDDDNDG